MCGQARLRGWSIGGSTGLKLPLAQRTWQGKKHPENETSPAPETLLSGCWSWYQDNNNFVIDTYALK